ncbi:myo-inosose-2 dehydratase [Bacillaceae bacterium SIJ1]|uniref:myo-inosose-2 dehydratase n=1 Tax=Litoribacterium kuwaitense TaxID=1398745 RepID=UPI0013EC0C84|nr:myo-inosose-2 dehydratase [Litoribacterium kuwaitense]NGP43817.1 myo-inosose-2 dehydratase [Litoribacterium kuwaitense]
MIKVEKVNIGCAPINWSNDDAPDIGGHLTFEQCISEIALAGYSGCELGSKFPKETSDLKKALNLRNLALCNGWFSAFFTTGPKEKTIEGFIKHRDFLHEMGAKVIGVGEVGSTVHGDEHVPLFSGRPYLTEEQFTALANGLNELGRLAKEKEMKIAFHYHIGTGIENFSEIKKLMELTDSELVHLLFDTGHAAVAGTDPLDILQLYGERISHIHIKDVRSEVLNDTKQNDRSFIDAVRKGLFTVPGDGDVVDMKRVCNKLKDLDYKGWIVVEAEQDPERANPLAYAIKARSFIKTHLGI